MNDQNWPDEIAGVGLSVDRIGMPGNPVILNLARIDLALTIRRRAS
jgi:hypothetical protein